jgi:transposase
MEYVGIDVAKDKLDSLWLRDRKTEKVKTKIHRNTPSEHRLLGQWLCDITGKAPDEIQVVIEATGIYHEAIAEYLYAQGFKVCVINPAFLRNYAKGIGVKTKTDKKDSLVLAKYGAAENILPWKPESSEARKLKAFGSRLNALGKDIQREKNRLEKAQIGTVPKEVIQSIRKIIKYMEKEKKSMEEKLKSFISNVPELEKDHKLLLSIPGVGPVVARTMLAMMRSRDFIQASQCAAYVGLVPVQHESGKSVRGRPRLSKTGSAEIRSILYMAAVTAIQHNPDIKAQYRRLLANGKCKMSAIGAAMRKLVHICFGVIKHQKPYQSQLV